MPGNSVPPRRRACTNERDGMLFSDYICDTLSDADKERFETHACRCMHCRDALERFGILTQLAQENTRLHLSYLAKLCENDSEDGRPN